MRIAMATAALLGLSACAGGNLSGPSQETLAAVSGTPSAVAERAESALAALGLVPVGGDLTRFSGNFSIQGNVADCPPIEVVVEDKPRIAEARDGKVDLALVPGPGANQTRAVMHFSGVYREPNVGGDFDRPCASQGTMEPKVMAALRGG